MALRAYAVASVLLLSALEASALSPSSVLDAGSAAKVKAVGVAAGREAAAFAALKELKGNGTLAPPPLPGEVNVSAGSQGGAVSAVQEAVEEVNVSAGSQGGAVSAVQEAGRIQWFIAKDELKDIGYHGSVNEFAVAFNNKTRELKSEVKERMLNGSDEELLGRVVLAVANREIGRIREEKVEALSVNESAADDDIESLVDEDEKYAIKNRLQSVSPAFKMKLAYIAVNGTEQERERLSEQLSGLASEDDRQMGARLHMLLQQRALNHTRIRAMLRGESELIDILSGEA